MPVLDLIQLLSLAAGIIVCLLVFLFPRFGKASWLLALFLIFCALSSGALAIASFHADWSIDASLRLSFSLLVAAAPLGMLLSYTVGREDYSKPLRKRRVITGLMLILAAIGIAWIYSYSAPIELELPPGEGALGPGGYFCALYLVLASIVVLSHLEQTLRNAQELVRWEIKFLLIGIGSTFGAIIYVASKVLLFSPRVGLLSLASLRLFSILFLFSCLFILVSWKRSTGRWKVAVSQSAIYSSITLLAVGIYLIVSSIVARWAGQWSSSEISMEALLFLVLLLILVVVLLWADLRHRVKFWIRRHILAGRYDYRQYWLEASERVRSVDPPDVAADALAGIVQKAIGAIDISVWLRHQNPTRLKLIGIRGDIKYAMSDEVLGVVDRLFDVKDPVPAGSLDNRASEEPMSSFLAQTNASVIVPLLSGDRIVGVLTVGPDRSGHAYNWDALEFLGVLGRHAAGELHKTELLSTLIDAKESEAFRTFSTFLLHDLKNFASTLSLIAQNASRYKDNPDFQRDAFQSIFDTAGKMKKLCNSLRTFSDAATEKKSCDLNHIATTVADNFSGDSESRIVLDLSEVPPVLVNAEEIERTLLNLLVNARQAIMVDGSITLRTRNHEGQVEISVEDDGCGMSSEFLEKDLFVPFRTTKSDGLGIGLYQSKKIVEAHQGTIRVESREGSGTIIRLFFPKAPAAQAEGETESDR